MVWERAWMSFIRVVSLRRCGCFSEYVNVFGLGYLLNSLVDDYRYH